METLNLSTGEASLDSEGVLVTKRYRNFRQELGEYCVHWDNSGHLMALICNPCSNPQVSVVILSILNDTDLQPATT